MCDIKCSVVVWAYWSTSFSIILLCNDGDDCDESYDDECEDMDDNDSDIHSH